MTERELDRRAAHPDEGRRLMSRRLRIRQIPDGLSSACCPPGADEAEALYRLVDAAYEKRSLILTSNLHPARFDSIFPKGLATAAVDRVLHHAHVIVTEGRSHRLTEALEGRGVTSLELPSA